MIKSTSFSMLHPIVCLLYFIGLFLIAMLLEHLLYLLLAVAVTFFVVILHAKISKQMVKYFMLIFLIMVLINPLFVRNGTTTVISFWGLNATLEGILYALKSGSMILLLILVFIPFNKVITNNKFLYLFSRIFPRGAMLLAMALRFVPLFKQRLQQVHEIQLTRGNSVNEGSMKARTKAGLVYMQVLLSISLEEALQTAASMKARGYSVNHRNRSSYQYFIFGKKDMISLVFLLFCFTSFILGYIHGYGQFLYFPELQSMVLTSFDLLYLGFLLLFIGFPILLEAGSQLRWHLLNLKM